MWICRTARTLLVLALCFCCLLPFDARADQIVTSQDLYRDIQHQSEQREQNLAILQGFISSSPVREMLSRQGADYGKVMKALPNLDDQELARLAAQAQNAETSFAAGYHDDTIRLLLIVLLVVAIVAIVVSVAD